MVSEKKLEAAGCQTATFDDYRKIDGLRLPFRIVIDDGQHPVTMTITSIEPNIAIDTSRFAVPPELRSSSKPAR